MTLHGQRGRDAVRVVYSRSAERGAAFRERWSVPESTTDLEAAIRHPETEVVVIGVPNFRHEEAIRVAATLSVQGHRVEVADEPGPEHRDRSSLHRRSSPTLRLGRLPCTTRRYAP